MCFQLVVPPNGGSIKSFIILQGQGHKVLDKMKYCFLFITLLVTGCNSFRNLEVRNKVFEIEKTKDLSVQYKNRILMHWRLISAT